MSDDERLEIFASIPEKAYTQLLAWLAAGSTGTVTFHVVAGRIVDVECVTHAWT